MNVIWNPLSVVKTGKDKFRSPINLGFAASFANISNGIRFGWLGIPASQAEPIPVFIHFVKLFDRRLELRFAASRLVLFHVDSP